VGRPKVKNGLKTSVDGMITFLGEGMGKRVLD
jgi:hypothetical protein